MFPEIPSVIRDLCARVEKLEQSTARTRRGNTNQRGAADYLGRSREWLRQRERRGDGPLRNPDGTYNFDNLDDFKKQSIA
jgi:hypothetical protein